ncbi:putative toxin-antitoxin system toxin component, PIN family [Succinivibrio dextrinosolvens]|jgi:hypothetical protein|uniref:putative toxin-antitoxin system toxin component, PIN family n=1 Tax=Succinivibrio dextrinosolvens TaxID=83771 RepID=UPI00241F9621|nr:putative toxin-antitoxin system toxin component, PIN family [Succinivibrio dextrinosolvens]MBE6422578.1 putative toxin-antitoxin system toxin component, PIN family [Succinivibrio dextrinosolvens]
MKILIDTNILVSGILWNKNEHIILENILNQKFEGVISPQILDEYKHGLTKTLYKTDKTLNLDFNEIIESFSVIQSRTKIYICRDPKDNKFLECAFDAQAYYIVSGDNDLISIKNEVKDNFEIEIITAKDFCQKFNLNNKLEENSNSFHR